MADTADKAPEGSDDDGPLSPEEIEHKKLFAEFAARHKEGGAAAAAAEPEPQDNGRDNDDDAGDPADTTTVTAVKPADPEDIWANATPSQLAARDALAADKATLEQYKRSNDGRIAGFQRQIDDLNKALAGRAEAATSAAATAADTKVDTATKSLNDLLTNPKFVQARKDYPEIYEPMVEALGGVLAEAATLKAQTTGLATELGELRTTATSKFERDNLREQTSEITTLDPDYIETVSKPEFRAAFDGWLDTQPQAIKDLVFKSAAGGVQNAKDASWAFRAFKRDTGFGGGQAAASTKVDTKTSTSSATDRTRRSLQLDTSTSVRSGRPSVIVDDKAGSTPQSQGEAAYTADWKRNVDRIKKRQQAEGVGY